MGLLERLHSLGYTQPGLVEEAIHELKVYYSDFDQPSIRKYEDNYGNSSDLLVLNGTLPIIPKRTSLPLQIWFPTKFPERPPRIKLKISQQCLLISTPLVDSTGEIHHDYINEWQMGVSNLADFLQLLSSEFSDFIPLVPLTDYNHPSKVKGEITDLRLHYPEFLPAMKKYDDDAKNVRVCLSGALSVKKTDSGETFLIMVNIWLPKSFPREAPHVFVVPSTNTQLRSDMGRHLYRSGRVNLKYLKDWIYLQSNLTVLVQLLHADFSSYLPIKVVQSEAMSPETQNNTSDLSLASLASSSDCSNISSLPPPVQVSTPPPDYRADSCLSERVGNVTDELLAFGMEAGLAHDTLDILAQNGFLSLRSLLSIESEYLDKVEQIIPLGQFLLLKEAITEYRRKLGSTSREGSRRSHEVTTSRSVSEETERVDHNPPNAASGNPISESVCSVAMKRYLSPCIIDTTDISMGSEIGKGHYGVVYKGKMKDKISGAEIMVAIKTTSLSQAKHDHDAYADLFQEILQMRNFDHQNVMNLLGVVLLSDSEPALVLPYMSKGDLKSYVADPQKDFTVEELLLLALPVAEGMEYLASKNFIHGDLAARNCLVDSNDGVKVCDFGLTRQLFRSDYYKFDANRKRPYRWMAPEAIRDQKNTLKSDVWSYGILLWEIMTRGRKPYPEFTDVIMLAQMIKAGYTMSCPPHTPPQIFSLMQQCWNLNQDLRPTFKEIIFSLKQLLFNKASTKSTSLPREPREASPSANVEPSRSLPRNMNSSEIDLVLAPALPPRVPLNHSRPNTNPFHLQDPVLIAAADVSNQGPKNPRLRTDLADRSSTSSSISSASSEYTRNRRERFQALQQNQGSTQTEVKTPLTQNQDLIQFDE